jgi:hypothetical protein
MRTFIAAAFVIVSLNAVFGGGLSLSAEYGVRDAAVRGYLLSNRQQIDVTLSSLGCDPAYLICVVYPELLRYSSFRDRFESAALKIAYVGVGRQGADFSIGPFQMKPSFAESVEEGIRTNDIPGFTNLLAFRSTDLAGKRRERVARLSSLGGELGYLAAFYQLARRLYPARVNATDREAALRFLCALYNAGIDRGSVLAEKFAARAHFPDGRGKPGLVYGDVAAAYWRETAGK